MSEFEIDVSDHPFWKRFLEEEDVAFEATLAADEAISAAESIVAEILQARVNLDGAQMEDLSLIACEALLLKACVRAIVEKRSAESAVGWLFANLEQIDDTKAVVRYVREMAIDLGIIPWPRTDTGSASSEET